MTLAAYTMRALPAQLSGLITLALDLRWSWHHGSDQLWRSVDADAWDTTHNAWLVLNSAAGEHLQALAEDPDFLEMYQSQMAAHRTFSESATWYSETCNNQLGEGVAWFCMEYGVSESLPLYSGGLGVLAGDFLKAASDLGVPVMAVGLLFQQGYFRQALNTDGEQIEFYPYNDPTMLPVAPLREKNGEWARVTVPFPGRDVRLRAWKGQVGRCELLLLDSNDPRNEPGDRGITSELYSGDPEKRLQQEMVLGIGGWRLLELLNRTPSACHINEGHSALAMVERAHYWQRRHKTDFATARLATRATNLFTTHTSVAAGFDRFSSKLAELYLSPWLGENNNNLGTLLSVANDSGKHLNMAGIALGMCGRFNGVSQIHQQVTQTIFQPWFDRWPTADIPADFVTNGVHTPSWDSPESDALWTQACGKDRWRRPLTESCPLKNTTDADLWNMRRAQRKRLIRYLRHRLRSQHCEHNFGNTAEAACGLLLDPETLTLGFARRFTSYKRPDLLLKDPDRLTALLMCRDRPLQIVLAGKAHPKDTEGKALIQRWKAYSRLPEIEGKVVFIEDYDLAVANQLIQGVDVWLNCPRHPWEACGTSGMKVLVNGGINLSQFDGWWAEAWNERVGWAIRPNANFAQLSQTDQHDDADALELYALLEQQVIPEFYRLNEQGLPSQWLNRIRASMEELTARYSANRMVREYVDDFYRPMIAKGALRQPEQARKMMTHSDHIAHHWPMLRFERLHIEEQGSELLFVLDIYLDGLRPDQIRIELVAEASEFGPRLVQPMQLDRALPGAEDSYEYVCLVLTRPADHFTPRIRVQDDRLNLPLEDRHILWYR
ncbi:MAG: starch phosphorylase [Marinobacter excellens HL-55]|uniref:Starch phosphorylase n=1 Tax=Marinobacter excellens HL-55 TaxID=1305731 RepID=A0A0P8D2V4_9GAMM|nr:MAG: starch phosphorylase [Marinobacter excellens HL-55]